MLKDRNSALALSYVSVAYNVLEGLISIAFAMRAGSPALLGFGIDSFVESLSGLVMVWRFSHRLEDETRERTAIRLVGISLMVLAGYVAYDAATALCFNEPPERSVVGLIIAALSLLTMPRFTCSSAELPTLYGAAVFQPTRNKRLVGSGLHYLFGVWQADPAAGLVIAVYLAREGYNAWTERELCC
jgi:divalent metal cation (Fe/Co/Zn/Cd) transporter